jgi:hypothetical protein
LAALLPFSPSSDESQGETDEQLARKSTKLAEKLIIVDQ